MNIRNSFLMMTAACFASTVWVAAQRSEPIQPLRAAASSDPAMVELGKKLFFDPRLSKSGFISCNSCHNLSMGGSDNLKSSVGDHWQKGPINSPTVLNATFNVAQFWDGRAPTLQVQAGGPIANPGEMAFTHELAIQVIASIPQYVRDFDLAFPEQGVTMDTITAAVAAFEDTLVTPNARFDKWLDGDDHALAPQERDGYGLFKSSGCVMCHNGPAVGGQSFQKMGVAERYVTDNPALGRAAVTQKDTDRFAFKVPTLRNVELTYPYFHDGAADTLAQAVEVMGRVQLGRRYSDAENAKIVAFLKTLTGDQPSFLLPQLPPSADKTPRPNPFK
jgi:cytochrome c peroxidase